MLMFNDTFKHKQVLPYSCREAEKWRRPRPKRYLHVVFTARGCAAAMAKSKWSTESRSRSSKSKELATSSAQETSEVEQLSEEWASSNNGGDNKIGSNSEDSAAEAQAVRSRAAAPKRGVPNAYEAQQKASIERNLARFRELGITNLAVGVAGAKRSKPPKAPERGKKQRSSSSSECSLNPNFVYQLLL